MMVGPIDKLNCFGDSASLGLHRDAVPQEAVDDFIIVVEAAGRVLGLSIEQVDGAPDPLI
jgi:hypothetical protein